MPGLCFANELISVRGSQLKPRHPYQPLAYGTALTSFVDLTQRDEGLHCDFACELYSMLENKLSDEEVHTIVGEAVEMEIEFVTSALPCGLIGMNAESMTEYVKYCADRLIVALGAPKLYNASQPYEWMTLISLQGKTNFFVRQRASNTNPETLLRCRVAYSPCARVTWQERRVSEYQVCSAVAF